jgi:hypothetical protein
MPETNGRLIIALLFLVLDESLDLLAVGTDLTLCCRRCLA